MNKKALYSILSTIVAMIVLSVSLVFAIGPQVSAYNEHDRILIIDDWDDFEFRPYGSYLGSGDYSSVCYQLSETVGCGLLGYSYHVCDYWGGANQDKLNEYDEIHVIFPDGVEAIDGHIFNTWFDSLNGKITYIKIPQTVKKVGREMLYTCHGAKVYCECSKEYADENWDQDWDYVGFYYDPNGDYVEGVAEIVWDCNKTIIFDTQDGTAVESQIVCVDSLVAKPTAPTKDGYEFKGWFVGDEEYDFNTPVTEDMTLTAKWEAKQVQPEIPTEENAEVNNQNNAGLIWGIAGTSAGVLIIAGIVVGIVISKRRRK